MTTSFIDVNKIQSIKLLASVFSCFADEEDGVDIYREEDVWKAQSVGFPNFSRTNFPVNVIEQTELELVVNALNELLQKKSFGLNVAGKSTTKRQFKISVKQTDGKEINIQGQTNTLFASKEAFDLSEFSHKINEDFFVVEHAIFDLIKSTCGKIKKNGLIVFLNEISSEKILS
jgi:hypothetical protein